jgi:hypothetical protein
MDPRTTTTAAAHARLDTVEQKVRESLDAAETDLLTFRTLREEVNLLSPAALEELFQLADTFKGCHVDPS